MYSYVYVVYYRFLCFQIVILQNSESRTWIQNAELKHELVYVLLSKYIRYMETIANFEQYSYIILLAQGAPNRATGSQFLPSTGRQRRPRRNLQGCRITVGSTCRLKTTQHTKELATVLFSSQSYVIQLNYSREHSTGKKNEEGLCPKFFLTLFTKYVGNLGQFIKLSRL